MAQRSSDRQTKISVFEASRSATAIASSSSPLCFRRAACLRSQKNDSIRARNEWEHRVAGGILIYMPRYFFNIYHESSSIDSVGEELPDDQTAWNEATIITGELVRELDGRFQPGQQWRLEVLDEGSELLYVIWLTGHHAK